MQYIQGVLRDTNAKGLKWDNRLKGRQQDNRRKAVGKKGETRSNFMSVFSDIKRDRQKQVFKCSRTHAEMFPVSVIAIPTG